MRLGFLLLALFVLPVWADSPVLRPSARLLFKNPELLQPGHCVAYREGGSGWIMTEPVFYLKGRVIAAEIRTRHVGVCPEVPGKAVQQYTREEFNRLALAYPCLEAGLPEQDLQLGMVRLQVTDWETPHARQAAHAGRLYRGMFIDKPLRTGMEIELEADLLEACPE